MIAYRYMADIMRSGALGVEIVLSGKLPSERAKSWRFSQGYLKKTGDPAHVVERAMAQAKTNLGVIGIKISILPPYAVIHDRITVDQAMLDGFKHRANAPIEVPVEKVEKKKNKKNGVKHGEKN